MDDYETDIRSIFKEGYPDGNDTKWFSFWFDLYQESFSIYICGVCSCGRPLSVHLIKLFFFDDVSFLQASVLYCLCWIIQVQWREGMDGDPHALWKRRQQNRLDDFDSISVVVSYLMKFTLVLLQMKRIFLVSLNVGFLNEMYWFYFCFPFTYYVHESRSCNQHHHFQYVSQFQQVIRDILLFRGISRCSHVWIHVGIPRLRTSRRKHSGSSSKSRSSLRRLRCHSWSSWSTSRSRNWSTITCSELHIEVHIRMTLTHYRSDEK